MNRQPTSLPLLASGFFFLMAPAPDCRANSERRFVAEVSSPRPAVNPGTPARAKAIFRFDRHFTALSYRLRISHGSALLGADLRCGGPDNPGPVVANLLGRIEGGLSGTIVIRAALSDANLALGADCLMAGGKAAPGLRELAAAMERGAVSLETVSASLPEGGVRGQIRPLGTSARTQPSSPGSPLELARDSLSRAEAAVSLAQAAAGQAAMAGNGPQVVPVSENVGHFTGDAGSHRTAAQSAAQTASLAISEATAAQNAAAVAARMAEDAIGQAQGLEPGRPREAEMALRLAGRAQVLATAALNQAQAALAAVQAVGFR